MKKLTVLALATLIILPTIANAEKICGEIFVARTIVAGSSPKFLTSDEGQQRYLISLTLPNTRETDAVLNKRQKLIDKLTDADSVCISGNVFERTIAPNKVIFR